MKVRGHLVLHSPPCMPLKSKPRPHLPMLSTSTGRYVPFKKNTFPRSALGTGPHISVFGDRTLHRQTSAGI